MAAIRELSGYPLGFPSEGKLQIWKFTREGSEGLRFDFNFNPVLDLSSPASAFRFFFDRLGEVDSGVGEEIVGRIATFALDQVDTTNWICGLFLLVVLETAPMRIDDGKKSKNSFYTEEVNEKGECSARKGL
nr:E3 ubiquitin ligase BIG BROTHER-related-like [Ipomoea trifida]